MKLERDESGMLALPANLPTNAQDLLMLMDEAANAAQNGMGVSSPTFDHCMRIFNQLNAHYQLAVSQELAKAHKGLFSATSALKVATLFLAGVTVLLGGVEIWKTFFH